MSPTSSDGSNLQVCELFRSIAGETTWAGLPAAFVRLSGCNLRCGWCDTQKAWEPGRDMPLERVVELLLKKDDRLVVVTGGEPLLQAGTIELCRRLLERSRQVLLETNGSLDVSGVPEGVRIILDVKTPSSGEHEKMDMKNLLRLRAGDEVKFIIADRRDFDWAAARLCEHNLPENVNILFSPASDLIEPKKLAGWILASGLTVRLQIQLHKVIWPGGAEGEQILDESGDS
jgi:7-carboxy-7-deazaguanine synthase